MPDTTPRATTPPPTTSPQDAVSGYRPVSALAIAALGVAILTTAIVLVIAISSHAKGQPILADWVVVLALVSVALSFVARWHVRRSEGTRAGLGLARTGMVLSVLCGLGYSTFLFATHLAVRNQARTAADQWFAFLAAEKPEMAFRLTRDPTQRSSIPEDAAYIRNRFGAGDYAMFLRSDVTRYYRSWKDKVRAEWVGVKQLESNPMGYGVEFNYTLRSPEGQFDLGVTAIGADDAKTGVREWQVIYSRTGVRNRAKTQLGQICEELQHECLVRFLPQWVDTARNAPDQVLALLKIEDKPPTAAQIEKLKSELTVRGAINAHPGGPTKPTGPPIIHVDPDSVRLVEYVEMNVPSLGTMVPTDITIQVTDDRLVKRMQELQAPGWEKNPVQLQWPLELPAFTQSPLKVVNINVRPGAPREVGLPTPSTSTIR